MALFLVKYCLLGASIAGVSPSSEMCTKFEVADCLVPVRSVVATLDLLRPRDWVLSLSTVPAYVHIRSAGGPAQYGCCFSTAAVSSDEIPETELVAVA